MLHGLIFNYMHVILFIHSFPGYLLTDTDCFYLFRAWQLSEILPQDRNCFKGREDWWCSSVLEYLSSTSEALHSVLNTAMCDASDCIYWLLCLSVDTNCWADFALWNSLGETLRSRRVFIRIYFGGIVEVLRFYLGTWVCSTHFLPLYTAVEHCFRRIQKLSHLAGHSSESLVRRWNLLAGSWRLNDRVGNESCINCNSTLSSSAQMKWVKFQG